MRNILFSLVYISHETENTNVGECKYSINYHKRLLHNITFEWAYFNHGKRNKNELIKKQYGGMHSNCVGQDEKEHHINYSSCCKCVLRIRPSAKENT